MSIAADGDETTRQPRLGRWLVWFCYLLMGLSLLEGVQWARTIYDLDLIRIRGGFMVKFVLTYVVPDCIAIAALIMAGLALLFWRRPAGFWSAFFLIWLAPLILTCKALLREGPMPDLGQALVTLLLIILQNGILHTLGASAFLLGAPRIQAAYGIKEPIGGDSGPHTSRTVWQPSWLGVLCVFLALPVLAIFPAIGTQIGKVGTLWVGHEALRQVISAAVAAPCLIAALLLAKYRRWVVVPIAIAVLWLMVPLLVAYLVAPYVTRAVTEWHYTALLARAFGFNLITAYAWTAYLLTAPRVQAIYPRPVEEVDVEAF
jgi:hypothetical protein